MSIFRGLGVAPLFVAALTVMAAGPAWGQEVATVGEVVNVIDAADGDDRFDFTFRARYQFQLTRIKLTQQCQAGEQEHCVPGNPGVVSFRDVARYTQERHMLHLDAVFGLFRDLELFISVPLILMDRRQLDFLQEGEVDFNHDSNVGVLQFPFNSADRSGVDQIIVGMSWLPFSQQRHSTLPTWLLRVEGRFAVGEKMAPACRDSDGSVPPRTGAGADGQWFTDDDTEGTPECDTDDSAGVGERTNDLYIRSTLSRRYGIIEPFIGFAVLLQFVEEGDPRYGDGAEFPLYAETHFGFELVPWERAEQQQFLRIGLYAWGGYNREVMNYGPLFDILGTNPNLRHSYDPADGLSDAEYNDPENALGTYHGLTRIEGHGTFGGRLTLTIQAARYIKFAIGVGVSHEQEHFISFTDQCRSATGDESNDTSGICEGTGIFDDNYREQIDAMGRRIRAEETTIFDASAQIFVQF